MVARVQIHAHQVKVLSGMSPVLLDQLSGMSSVEVCEETLCSMIDVSSLGFMYEAVFQPGPSNL